TGNGSLNIGAGAGTALLQVATSSGTGHLGSITMSAGSHFDLVNNNMIITSGANIPALIKQAANLGQWTGITGITSSRAQASIANSTRTALGYATGAQFTANTGFVLFNGQPFSPTDTLVMYTLDGDANMDGSATFSDFLKLQNAYNQLGTDWQSGDFN